ncbi:MAG TPA: hypothetical protein VGD49_14820 [Longimicrobiales bacterium]
MRKQLVWLMAAPLLAGCDLDLSGLGSCQYDESWTESVSASGISTVELLADAGDLRIEGRSDINTVRVRATACANNRNTLDEIDFDFFFNGSTLEIESFAPLRDNSRIDLVIEVPVDMALAIFHDEGNIEVSNVDVVFIDDESGNIQLNDIYFDVDIEDESGNIDIFRVGGDVTIEDGSGDIDVDDIGGDFRVLFDSSGTIRHRNVRGVVDLP